ncbi:MAG TPA: hypothetical protein VIE12_12825 [Actinomycetota bacterium]|jgi:hypothetical protein
MSDRIWEIRNPDGGSQGLEVARGRSGEHAVMLAHAMPERIDVTVTEPDGAVIATGRDLYDERSTPISRLTIVGNEVRRENVWPRDGDLGVPVILPGGEIGILTAWWNADDGSEWRWSIELRNHA